MTRSHPISDRYERSHAAFRPRENLCLVWHFPRTMFGNRNLFLPTDSRDAAGMRKLSFLLHSPPFHYGLCFYKAGLCPLSVVMIGSEHGSPESLPAVTRSHPISDRYERSHATFRPREDLCIVWHCLADDFGERSPILWVETQGYRIVHRYAVFSLKGRYILARGKRGTNVTPGR